MWLKRIFLIIGILATVGAGSFVLYNVAYAVGDADGYDDGYLAGQNVGYISGNQDGYSLGHDEGYDQGQADGYDQGYEAGVTASIGHSHCLKDPTYAEALAFLRSDQTDRNEYNDISYVCSHFARDVDNNAEAAGLRCAFVELRYLETGHSIIAFNTIDRGLVYFEPQFDDEVKVEIGQSYSHLNHYIPSPTDDHILDVLVIW